MNCKQRIMAALRGDPVDRVPVFIMSRQYAMKRKNLSFKTCLEDFSGEKYANAQAEAFALYGYDGVMDLEGVSAESEAFGCELSKSENESPTVISPRIQHYDELEQLEIPDFEKSSVLQRQFNVIKALRRLVAEDVPIYANVQCPFRSAAMLRGLNNFLLDLIENAPDVHALLEVTTLMAILYGKRLIEAGADILMPSNPLGSGNIISKQHYEKFVFPYEKRMVDSFRETGIPTILHICGKTQDRLCLIADTGYDGVSVDSIIDLDQAGRDVGNKICLVGNLDVFQPLRNGTPQDVTKGALECIKAKNSGGGFMLSGSCEIIPDTPEQNLIALIEAARAAI